MQNVRSPLYCHAGLRPDDLFFVFQPHYVQLTRILDFQRLPLSSSQGGQRASKGMCQFGSATRFVPLNIYLFSHMPWLRGRQPV